MLPDPLIVADILREAAAVEVMPRFRSLATEDVWQKTGPADLVTVADEATERFLTRRLGDLLPGSLVVGEEAVAADPAIMDRISDDRPVWIIDPIDGTLNFVKGKPMFVLMVALAVGGQTVGGWIYDPCQDLMAATERGSGVRYGDQQARLAPAGNPAGMRGAIGTRFFKPPMRDRLKQGITHVGSVFSLGCAGQEYLRLISGAAQFSLYNRIMPWDHAAGTLMLTELGGHSALLDGRPYTPTLLEGGVLNAPDLESWQQLRRLLLD
jgi:fructose-1,6-bisphosphatase/inositol monophosphatase family enzyme